MMHLQFDYYRIKKFYLDDRPEELYQRAILGIYFWPCKKQEIRRTEWDRNLALNMAFQVKAEQQPL